MSISTTDNLSTIVDNDKLEICPALDILGTIDRFDIPVDLELEKCENLCRTWIALDLGVSESYLGKMLRNDRHLPYVSAIIIDRLIQNYGGEPVLLKHHAKQLGYMAIMQPSADCKGTIGETIKEVSELLEEIGSSLSDMNSTGYIDKKEAPRCIKEAREAQIALAKFIKLCEEITKE